MTTEDRRNEKRETSSTYQHLMSCVLVVDGETIPIEIENFHVRGACLKVARGDFRIMNIEGHLSFSIGLKPLDEEIEYRIAWESIDEDGTCGVEFRPRSSYTLNRASRFMVSDINSPVVKCADPLDLNRQIYFRVINASKTGLALVTSLSNRHLLPGMEVREAVLTIAGFGETTIGFYIENARILDGNQLCIGVSLDSHHPGSDALLSKYLTTFGQTQNPDERLEKLADAGFLQKKTALQKYLTIREVHTQSEYDAVLKLRFDGYSRVGKVAVGKDWRSMGEGLGKEGIVVATYLAGQLIASAEIRINRVHGVRTSEKINLSSVPQLKTDHLIEVNRLVLHAKAQGTDAVVGMFQRIHAIALAHGSPDFICIAEPKLVPLYGGIGFKKTEFTYPHPVVPEKLLTLMYMPRETHEQARGINPEAWTLIYGNNMRLMAEVGMSDFKGLPLLRMFQLKVQKPILNVARKLKKKRASKNPGQSKHKAPTQHIRFVDSKWTKMHLNATVLWPYMLEAREMLGEQPLAKILEHFGLNVNYFQNVSNWVSIEFFDEFIEQFSHLGDPHALNRRAGFRNISPEILGSNYYILKHCLSPGTVIKSLQSSVRKFNKTRILEVLESGDDFCWIRIRNPDLSLLPKHPSAKENWYAVFEGIVLVVTGKPARIEKIRSAFDGDAHCEFKIFWKNPTLSIRRLAGALTVCVTMAAVYKFLFSTVTQMDILTRALCASTVVLAPLALFFVYRAATDRRKYREMVEALALYERQADERYRELQNSKGILEKNYQEGQLLGKIQQEIQKSSDLSDILQTSLDSLKMNYGLTRSFAMIKDANSDVLRTAAVSGVNATIRELWDFTVDVSVQRESSLLLSSVYHSGQSVLIPDVERHKAHLNEHSVRLIESLKSRSFAIIPIPSQKKNWG